MADLGHYALRLGLFLAGLGLVAGIYGGMTRADRWTRVAERSVWMVFGASSVAMIALFWALATNDFSLSYVAAHSARTMPLHYRLGALWGGQAGSLLLWGWMLTAYGAVAVWGNRDQNRALMPWVCVALLANVIFFLGLVNFESMPFERVAHDQRLSDGNGLNPLLQHPVMMIHPVMLYTGFTGFALLQRFTHTDDGRQPGRDRGLSLGADKRVALAMVGAALGVAGNNIATAQIGQHQSGYVPGMRP